MGLRTGQVLSWVAYGMALLLFGGALYHWIFEVPRLYSANVGAALLLSGVLAGLIGRILAGSFPGRERA
jgi:hypothetical protein